MPLDTYCSSSLSLFFSFPHFSSRRRPAWARRARPRRGVVAAAAAHRWGRWRQWRTAASRSTDEVCNVWSAKLPRLHGATVAQPHPLQPGCLHPRWPLSRPLVPLHPLRPLACHHAADLHPEQHALRRRRRAPSCSAAGRRTTSRSSWASTSMPGVRPLLLLGSEVAMTTARTCRGSIAAVCSALAWAARRSFSG